MALSCGIIGLPTVGKTTFFNLLTNAGAETAGFFTGKTGTNVNMATIPDERLEFLAELYHPKKTIYAQIEITDVPGLVRGSSQGQGVGNQFLTAVRDADALMHVVRAFRDDRVLHVDGSIDIMRDVETIALELLFADLQLVEKRIERIKAGKKIKKEHQIELAAMEKCYAALEEEKPLAQVELTAEEKEVLRHITFLTEKPMILVVNVDEEQLTARDYPGRDSLWQYAADKGMPVLEICAQAEVEINQLDPADRELFMQDLGITEPGIKRLAKVIYDKLGLISFLTAGEDEVKAWTIKKGTNARQAAGKIHSDIERGFIRAEVVAFADLKKYDTMAKAREAGVVRLEGKEYIVQDGDIIEFRFNV